MVKYRSKIGWIFVLVIAIMVIASFYRMLEHGISIGSLLLVLISFFIVYIILYTYYEIGEGVLRIKSGLLLNRSIQIDAITSIEATNNPISAPAISLDRLEVFYGKHESVVVSPKEKSAFITHLKRINPEIQDNSGL